MAVTEGVGRRKPDYRSGSQRKRTEMGQPGSTWSEFLDLNATVPRKAPINGLLAEGAPDCGRSSTKEIADRPVATHVTKAPIGQTMCLVEAQEEVLVRQGETKKYAGPKIAIGLAQRRLNHVDHD